MLSFLARYVWLRVPVCNMGIPARLGRTYDPKSDNYSFVSPHPQVSAILVIQDHAILTCNAGLGEQRGKRVREDGAVD